MLVSFPAEVAGGGVILITPLPPGMNAPRPSQIRSLLVRTTSAKALGQE